MRIDEISVFVRVLEAGSFTGAARRLGIPTTTVSAKVAALERRLGVTLIKRTTRRMRVTDAGQVYFDRCRTGLREIEAAEAEVAAETGRVAGLLRLTAPVDIAQDILPPVIARFREAMPEVRVEIIVTDRIADLIAEGIDLAIRVGPLRDSSLVTRSFMIGPTGLFACPRYLDRRGTPRSLADLAQHDLIGFGKSRGRPIPMRMGSRKVEVSLTGAVTCDDFHATRAFIAMGLGIGFLPAFLAEDFKLVRVLPELRSDQTGLFFAYPAQKFVPPRVKRFIAFAVDMVGRSRRHGS